MYHLLFLIGTLLNNQSRDNSDVRHLLSICRQFKSSHFVPFEIEPGGVENGEKPVILIVHEGRVALPMVRFSSVRKIGFPVNMEGSMFDVFEVDDDRLVLEVDFGHTFLLGTQDAGRDDGAGFRAAVNDNFVVRCGLTVKERFLRSEKHD